MKHSLKHHSLPALLLLPAFVSCAIVANEETPPPEQPQAYYYASCSPVDGPAFEVIIPSVPSSCQDILSIPYDEPWAQTFTRIYIFQTLSADRIYQFGESIEPGSGYSTGGWAGRCDKGTTSCIIARTGTLQLFAPAQAPPNGTPPQADIDISYEDGGSLSSLFELIECKREQPFFCG